MNFSTSRVYMFSGTDGTWQELDAEKIVNFERVFNALTDNGKQEGIYMQNGHLYINASYIKSGQISADLISLKTLMLQTVLEHQHLRLITTEMLRSDLIHLY